MKRTTTAGLALATLLTSSAFALASAPAASAAIRCDSPGNLIVGTSGDDHLVGTSGRDVIEGRGGNDTIEGLGGNDTLRGGPGNDYLIGAAGWDCLFGNGDADLLDSSTFVEVGDLGYIDGGGGDDTIFEGDEWQSIFWEWLASKYA